MDRRLLATTGAVALVASATLLVTGLTRDVGTVDLTGAAAGAPSVSPTTSPSPRQIVAAAPIATASPTPHATDTLAETASPAPAVVGAPTPVVDVATSSARLSDIDLSPASPPTGLSIPAIGVKVAVAALGIDEDGQMAIPEDVADAGWYRYGPAPGQAGNAVIAGHVDARVQGLGAFDALTDLDVGDIVTVTNAAGSTTDFAVTGREEIAKEILATDDLFRRDGPAQLILVTCGGDFDADARSYRSNVVVVAQPL